MFSHHRESQENQNLVGKFKKNVMEKIPYLENFSKNISCYSETVGTISVSKTLFGRSVTASIEADVCDNAIFMLQSIEVEGHLLNLFFDNGCGDMVIRVSG